MVPSAHHDPPKGLPALASEVLPQVILERAEADWVLVGDDGDRFGLVSEYLS